MRIRYGYQVFEMWDRLKRELEAKAKNEPVILDWNKDIDKTSDDVVERMAYGKILARMNKLEEEHAESEGAE